MPDRPFGSNSLAVPIYLASGHGADDPGLAVWKQEHPNWMVAGSWTPAPRPTRIMPPTPNPDRTTTRPDPNAGFSSLDPATISVADFRHLAGKPDEPAVLPEARARSSQVYPDNHDGLKPSVPTNSITTHHPGNTLEAMSAGREDNPDLISNEPSTDHLDLRMKPCEAQ